MKEHVPAALERGRVDGDPAWGFYGCFIILRERGPKTELRIIASGGDTYDVLAQGWEHVSVSTATRVPTWEEMCLVKGLCWDDDECVIQFHPPRRDYVNVHPYTLHLWKPPYPIPLPPREFV